MTSLEKTPTSSRRSSRVTISRLADAVRRLSEYRSTLESIRVIVDGLAHTRLTSVVGEHKLTLDIAAIIHSADQYIAQVPSGTSEQQLNLMVKIEECLEDPSLKVSEVTLNDLRERKTKIDEYVRSLSEEFRTLRLNFDKLQKLIERAERIRFEAELPQKALASQAVGRMRKSENDFKVGRFDRVAVAVSHAKNVLTQEQLANHRADTGQIVIDAEKFASYTAELEVVITAAEKREAKLERRTELFLISGKSTADSTVPYKVLLRRPGYKDIQEVSLYEDVEILLSDQEQFQGTVDSIGVTALDGIRAAANPADPSGGAVAPLRRALPARTVDEEPWGQLEPAVRLERIGRRMYSLLIPDAMQRLIDETDEFPLTVTSNNPELPWELLHDGNEFLCLKRTFARMPAGQTFPRRTRDNMATGTDRAQRVLLIHSVHGEPLGQAEAEINAIVTGLAGLSPAPAVTKLTGSEVTLSRLTDELSLGNYDLIHYAGHAGYDENRPERSYLLLSSGEHFQASRVQRLLEGHPVVILNACESSKSAPQGPASSIGSIVAQAQGLASAFVYGGAQACIGTLWPVFDDTAAALSVEFYKQLIEKHQRVGEALRRARIHSRQQKQDQITWAAYALYGDPSHRLGAPVIS